MPLPNAASLNDFGGIKQNDSPVEDYTTDEDATDRNECFADCAAMTHTAVRCWRAFVGNATTPTDPTSAIHDSNWGDSLAIKSVVARTGTGVYTITFPTTVTDELGITRTLNLRRALANVEGTVPYFVTTTVTSPNVITLRVFTYSGGFAASDAVGVTFTVFAV